MLLAWSSWLTPGVGRREGPVCPQDPRAGIGSLGGGSARRREPGPFTLTSDPSGLVWTALRRPRQGPGPDRGQGAALSSGAAWGPELGCPHGIPTQADILGTRMVETGVTTSEVRPAWGGAELRGRPHRHPGALTGACHRQGGPSGSWPVLRLPLHPTLEHRAPRSWPEEVCRWAAVAHGYLGLLPPLGVCESVSVRASSSTGLA